MAINGKCLARAGHAILMVALMAACSGNSPVDPAASGTPAPVQPTAQSPSAAPTVEASAPPSGGQSGAPKRRAVTVVMNGDLLWHNTLWFGAQEDARRRGQGGYDFAPLLAGIKPVVAAADLAICHEEVPLAPRGGPYRNYPRFAAPPQVVRAVKVTGYDVCTTASNHSLDEGFAGVRRTIKELDRAEILHAGTYLTARAARRPTIFTTRQGVKIAVVAGTFGTNGLPLPPGRPWAVSQLDARSLLRQAKLARKVGADIVLIAAHAGTEYSSQANDEQRRLARTLTRSPDVDLVYMHHAHVVQPWTKINGKWVVYGLGNTVAQHETPVQRGYEGVTARFMFSPAGNGGYRVSKAEYIPTYVTRYLPGSPARLMHVQAALRGARGPLRTRLLTAQRRTTTVVTALNPPGLRRA